MVAQPKNKAKTKAISTVNEIAFFIFLLLFVKYNVNRTNLLGKFKSQNHLYRLPPLNDSDQYNDNGNHQQDMNKITHRIAGHQTERP
jgi:hypothetical protein